MHGRCIIWSSWRDIVFPWRQANLSRLRLREVIFGVVDSSCLPNSDPNMNSYQKSFFYIRLQFINLAIWRTFRTYEAIRTMRQKSLMHVPDLHSACTMRVSQTRHCVSAALVRTQIGSQWRTLTTEERFALTVHEKFWHLILRRPVLKRGCRIMVDQSLTAS